MYEGSVKPKQVFKDMVISPGRMAKTALKLVFEDAISNHVIMLKHNHLGNFLRFGPEMQILTGRYPKSV